MQLWNSRDCSKVPWVWKTSIPKHLDWWKRQSIQRETHGTEYSETQYSVVWPLIESDAKIIKEGKDVTLPQVMEIAHLEVSIQKHIDRLQETTKVNYVQYGKGSKTGKPKSSGKGSTSGGSSGSSGKPTKPSGKGRKVPLPTDICWRCGKRRHQKGQPCKAVRSSLYETVPQKDIMRKCVWKENQHTSIDVPSTSSHSEPDYFNEHGDPVYAHAHTWSMWRKLITRNTWFSFQSV